jgi:hypothetical protein
MNKMLFQQRYFAGRDTRAAGASRNFIHVFSNRGMRSQKIMDQFTFAHNYGYVVGDLMGIDHDHAKRCFQLLTTFFAVHIKYGML